jgi:hypothetical protein
MRHFVFAVLFGVMFVAGDFFWFDGVYSAELRQSARAIGSDFAGWAERRVSSFTSR